MQNGSSKNQCIVNILWVYFLNVFAYIIHKQHFHALQPHKTKHQINIFMNKFLLHLCLIHNDKYEFKTENLILKHSRVKLHLPRNRASPEKQVNSMR